MPPKDQSTDFNFPGRDNRFNDPFLLNSNSFIPNDFFTTMEFASYLACQNPIYTQATRRTVSHFVTDFEFVGKSGDQSEKNELRDYLTNSLGLLEALQQAGLERFIFGNSFLRVYYPFDRYLVDRRNGRCRHISIKAFGDDITFNLAEMKYYVPDPDTLHLEPSKRKRVGFEFLDRKSHDASRITLRLMTPTRMSINMNFISGKCEYVYRFDEFFRAAVERGTPIHQINDTPMDMLLAIKNGQDFVFNPDTIFHFKNSFISGISMNGWGIPNIILNYTPMHQMQVLRCINESIGLDYMLPFRLLSPAPTASGGGADSAASTNLGRWTSSMRQLIANSRKDRKALHAVPFPVTYQELGGNGKSLSPVELMKYQMDEVLDGAGYPSELWHMSLQTQQVPTAIRLFESTFVHLSREFNNAVRWATRNILNYLEKEQIGIKLQLPSIADDVEKRHIWLQLAAGGEVSRATAYRAFNIDDPIEESKRRAQEDIEIQEAKQKTQSDFERKMTLGSANQVVDAMVQGQGGPGGVAPGGGGPGMPPAPAGGQAVTPLDIDQQAEEQATSLLQIQDTGERRKAMMQIKASNPTLYAVVQRKMEDMRQQGASQGRKSVGQQ